MSASVRRRAEGSWYPEMLAAVPVLPGDTAETLAARVLVQEHRIYPAALARIAAGPEAGMDPPEGAALCNPLPIAGLLA